ncbi:cytochrome c oxidase subunit IVB [Bacillus sp. RG28]|uniref:Cytochrome c oxidase subunit IVB n=2 Tax=Gottfriedia endophytica TaxID=2820819 RepID=A0A940NQ01_9BACI|nr:cytochrome c oxidase subunit IVB [Gottfriedia endophytica]
MEMNANSHQNKVDLKYRRKKSAEEMKHQLISFVMMILLTVLSFVSVIYRDHLDPYFTIPFIILLAVIQLVFQLYYFMHMKNKEHGIPAMFLYSGLVVGLVTVLAFVTIVWL